MERRYQGGVSSRTHAWERPGFDTGHRTNEAGATVRRHRSKLRLWVPGGYLVVVLGLVVWVEVLSRTGDAGFAGIWPIIATAPVSVVVMQLFVSVPEAPVVPPDALVHTGPREPAPVPLEEPPAPPPPDWTPDPSAGEPLEAVSAFGFYAPVLVGALVNATAIWAVVRVLVRRRGSGGSARG